MSLASRIRSILRPARSGIPYWEKRAAKYGARSVFNLEHPPGELDLVTDRQRKLLFDLFRRQLRGDESLVLDFGCGTGRFTPGLASLTGGRAIGLDPIATLLELAPRSPAVEYRLLRDRIPLEAGEADAVWVCLVLGTIIGESELREAVAEIERVLADGGLLFLVENTAPKADLPHFRFRPAERYASMFPHVPLRVIGSYDDLGEPISVFAGRKQTA